MQFSTPVLLVSLAAMASAAPMSPAISSVLEKREGYCGDSTFDNASSSASPLISDCQILSSNIAGGGSWTFGTAVRTIAIYGTCAFSVYSDREFTTIGNDDVRDLIRDSIAKFSWQGKVGAGGVMSCGTTVHWGIYHS